MPLPGDGVRRLSPAPLDSPSDVLEVSHLTVEFGRTQVLRDLSFTVRRGSTLAVIGPNGAGKTILFKALIGALPHQGAIRWATDAKIGYVPQKLDLERDLPLTGIDLLRAKTVVMRVAPAEIAAALGLVSLDPQTAAKPIGTLSGGQFQRLLLAFALLGQPNVLLFDEPTAGVDVPGEESIYEMIRRLQETHQLTLLLISHELNLVYRFATEVLCLSHVGSCLGPPVEILTPERLHETFGAPLKFHLHSDMSP